MKSLVDNEIFHTVQTGHRASCLNFETLVFSIALTLILFSIFIGLLVLILIIFILAVTLLLCYFITIDCWTFDFSSCKLEGNFAPQLLS